MIEDARLAILSRDAFLSFVRTNPDVALEMLSALTDSLRRTDDLLRSRVSRNANERRRSAPDARRSRGGLDCRVWWQLEVYHHLDALIIFWMVFNSFILIRGFDPAPYAMLNLVLAVIAGMQAPIIMMSQNRQGEKDRLRADLDYQVNLKNELSLAEVLRRLDVLESERLPKLFEDLRTQTK